MKCPRCNSNLVKIVYGMPSPEMIAKAEKKEIYIGGCEVNECPPIYHCYKCNINYFKNLKDFIPASIKFDENMLDSVVNDSKFIFSYKLSDAWNYLIYNVKIYNRKENNIIIHTNKRLRCFTISQNDINEIINIISNGNLYNINHIDFPPVFDGNQSEFILKLNSKEHTINAYNLWYWEENPCNDQDTNTLIKRLNEIKAILKKNNIDLEKFDLQSY